MCTEPGKTAEGVQGQKRLILEHAAEMYDQLRSGAGQKLALEVGYSMEKGDEVEVCKARFGLFGPGGRVEGVCPWLRVMPSRKTCVVRMID